MSTQQGRALREKQYLLYSFIFIIAWNTSAWLWDCVQVRTLRFKKTVLKCKDTDVSPKLVVHRQLPEMIPKT